MWDTAKCYKALVHVCICFKSWKTNTWSGFREFAWLLCSCTSKNSPVFQDCAGYLWVETRICVHLTALSMCKQPEQSCQLKPSQSRRGRSSSTSTSARRRQSRTAFATPTWRPRPTLTNWQRSSHGFLLRWGWKITREPQHLYFKMFVFGVVAHFLISWIILMSSKHYIYPQLGFCSVDLKDLLRECLA